MEQKKVASLVLSVLKVVGAAGLIASALVAPNIAKALPLLVGKRGPCRHYPAYLTRALDRLRFRNCIALVKKDGKAYYQLTEKGSALLAKYVLQETVLPRPHTWDRKWRILIFDIPETRKPTRENIRRSLERLGLTRLQDSVWIYPYPCEDVMELLRTSYGVRHDALYLTTERFWGDHDLLSTYGLPSDED